MEQRPVYYANGLVELQDAPAPHHLRVGGYPELVADHCELVDRVAKLETRIDEIEMRLVRLYGLVARHTAGWESQHDTTHPV